MYPPLVLLVLGMSARPVHYWIGNHPKSTSILSSTHAHCDGNKARGGVATCICFLLILGDSRLNGNACRAKINLSASTVYLHKTPTEELQFASQTKSFATYHRWHRSTKGIGTASEPLCANSLINRVRGEQPLIMLNKSSPQTLKHLLIYQVTAPGFPDGLAVAFLHSYHASLFVVVEICSCPACSAALRRLASFNDLH